MNTNICNFNFMWDVSVWDTSAHLYTVVLKYEMGNFGRNGAKWAISGRNGQLLGEMGMIHRVMT